MLNGMEIAELREKVLRAWTRACAKGKPIVGIYRGGPLDGLPAALDEKKFAGPGEGWCVVTRTGPIVAWYRGRGPFRDFDACRDPNGRQTYLPVTPADTGTMPA